MNTSLTAQDIMAKGVITLETSQSLDEAFHILEEQRISGAPVLDSKGDLVGVLSQADLLKHAFAGPFFDFAPESFYIGLPFVDGQTAESFSERLRQVSVEDAMSPNVLSLSPETPVVKIAEEMQNYKVHRMLVEQDGKVVGIITTFDLLKVIT